MKIYTKKGDRGITSFIGGCKVKKFDPLIECYGILDELNSILGVTRTFIEEDLSKVLDEIQHHLFTLGSELASITLKKKTNLPRLGEEHISILEKHIDDITDKLPEQKNFIIPGGTRSAAYLHMARAMTRRAERQMFRLAESIDLSDEVLAYINRLSDLLYVMARKANKEGDMKEQQPIYKYFHG